MREALQLLLRACRPILMVSCEKLHCFQPSSPYRNSRKIGPRLRELGLGLAARRSLVFGITQPGTRLFDHPCTGRPDRMSYRKWGESKQQPSRARSLRPSNQLLLSFPPIPVRHRPVLSQQKLVTFV